MVYNVDMLQRDGRTEILAEFEQFVLLAVLHVGTEAYGVPVRREIERRLRRSVSRGAVYVTLDRLEAKGYLASRFGDPAPERGGRSKRCYAVTHRGHAVLAESRRALVQMWDGFEPLGGEV